MTVLGEVEQFLFDFYRISVFQDEVRHPIHEARAVLKSRAVAAVLCDIRMPGESGIDLLRALAVDFADVAVIMTTGIDDPQTAKVAIDIGAYGYVIKPFEINELLINLASALRRRDLRDHQL